MPAEVVHLAARLHHPALEMVRTTTPRAPGLAGRTDLTMELVSRIDTHICKHLNKRLLCGRIAQIRPLECSNSEQLQFVHRHETSGKINV